MNSLPADLIAWIERHFAPADVPQAVSLLAGAVIHTGEPPGPRLLRCAAVGSQGKLERLQACIHDLRIDWRDVIVGAEYEVRDGKLVHVRNLSNPMDA